MRVTFYVGATKVARQLPKPLDYRQILTTAWSGRPTPERPSGCGRIYVCLSDKEHVKGIAKAAKALNKIFERKAHYGLSNALYVGYDNCDGHALARGTQIVQTLQAAGINCYRTEEGD